MNTDDVHATHQRFVRVGVCDSAAERIVTDVTLPPGSSVLVGSALDCTVSAPAALGIARHLVIEGGRLLHFSLGMRLQMTADGNQEHTVGEAEDLFASGWSSPMPLRWHRLNIRLSPGVSVFIKYLPSSDAGAAPAVQGRR